MVEDAISGLKSGHAAGSLTLAVCTSTPRATIVESGANPTYIVADLTKYVFSATPSNFQCALTLDSPRVNINVVNEKLEVTIDQS